MDLLSKEYLKEHGLSFVKTFLGFFLVAIISQALALLQGVPASQLFDANFWELGSWLGIVVSAGRTAVKLTWDAIFSESGTS
jgi:hypothetical protein